MIFSLYWYSRGGLLSGFKADLRGCRVLWLERVGVSWLLWVLDVESSNYRKPFLVSTRTPDTATIFQGSWEKPLSPDTASLWVVVIGWSQKKQFCTLGTASWDHLGYSSVPQPALQSGCGWNLSFLFFPSFLSFSPFLLLPLPLYFPSPFLSALPYAFKTLHGSLARS